MDGSGGGVGDFAGLTWRLHHIAKLGVNCIWLLPFYSSPRLDHGYDVRKSPPGPLSSGYWVRAGACRTDGNARRGPVVHSDLLFSTDPDRKEGAQDGQLQLAAAEGVVLRIG
jgi:hypothetical protein